MAVPGGASKHSQMHQERVCYIRVTFSLNVGLKHKECHASIRQCLGCEQPRLVTRVLLFTSYLYEALHALLPIPVCSLYVLKVITILK